MQHARLLGKNTKKKDFHAASVQVQLFPILEKKTTHRRTSPWNQLQLLQEPLKVMLRCDFFFIKCNLNTLKRDLLFDLLLKLLD